MRVVDQTLRFGFWLAVLPYYLLECALSAEGGGRPSRDRKDAKLSRPCRQLSEVAALFVRLGTAFRGLGAMSTSSLEVNRIHPGSSPAGQFRSSVFLVPTPSGVGSLRCRIRFLVATYVGWGICLESLQQKPLSAFQQK